MSKARSTFQEKVAWMVNHYDLWKEWPTIQNDRAIIQGMRNDGLISTKSNDYGIMDFGKLIAAARVAVRSHLIGNIRRNIK